MKYHFEKEKVSDANTFDTGAGLSNMLRFPFCLTSKVTIL